MSQRIEGVGANEPAFYDDFTGLQAIKRQPDGLEAAASQFEVQFLQTVLKHMRSASDAMQDEEDRLIKGESLYRDMYDSQLAMSMVKRGGMGLKEQMVNQLAPTLKNAEPVVASEPQTLAAFSQPLNSAKMRKVD